MVLTVKLSYMNTSAPISKVVNLNSDLCGCETNVQKSRNMAVYAGYGWFLGGE